MSKAEVVCLHRKWDPQNNALPSPRLWKAGNYFSGIWNHAMQNNQLQIWENTTLDAAGGRRR
jgi:hypothetical protein